MALTKRDLVDLANVCSTDVAKVVDRMVLRAGVAPDTVIAHVDNWRVTHAAAEWRPCLHCGEPTRGRTRREWSSHTGEWCFSRLCADARPEPNRHDRKRAAKVAS